jgi:hypothetical protein
MARSYEKGMLLILRAFSEQLVPSKLFSVLKRPLTSLYVDSSGKYTYCGSLRARLASIPSSENSLVFRPGLFIYQKDLSKTGIAALSWSSRDETTATIPVAILPGIFSLSYE